MLKPSSSSARPLRASPSFRRAMLRQRARQKQLTSLRLKPVWMSCAGPHSEKQRQHLCGDGRPSGEPDRFVFQLQVFAVELKKEVEYTIFKPSTLGSGGCALGCGQQRHRMWGSMRKAPSQEPPFAPLADAAEGDNRIKTGVQGRAN